MHPEGRVHNSASAHFETDVKVSFSGYAFHVILVIKLKKFVVKPK